MTQRPKIPIKRRIACPKVRFCKKIVLVHCRSFEVLWRSEEVIWWQGHLKYNKFIEISVNYENQPSISILSAKHTLYKSLRIVYGIFIVLIFLFVYKYFFVRILYGFLKLSGFFCVYKFFCTDSWNCTDFFVWIFFELYGFFSKYRLPLCLYLYSLIVCMLSIF